MPQQEETFLYRIITQLEDEEAFSQVSQELSMIADKTEQAGGKIQNLGRELGKMLPQSNLDKVQKKLSQISGTTDIEGLKLIRQDLVKLKQEATEGSQASQRLKKVISAIDSSDFQALSKHVGALQGELAETTTPIQEIRDQLERVGQADNIEEAQEAFQNLRTLILQNEDALQELGDGDNVSALMQRIARLDDTFQDTKNSVALAGGAIEQKIGKNLQGVNTQVDQTRLKTNQMSQAILQGAQDAQFGVIGVANNIQMLGQSMSRQMQKGVSMTRVLGDAMKNLVAGPFAIGTVITAVTLLGQNWDSVKSAGVSALQSVGVEIEAQQSALEDLSDEVSELDKNFSDIGAEEFLGFFEDLSGKEGGEGFLELTRKRLNEVRAELAPFRSRMENLKNTLSPKYSDAVLATQEAMGMWNNAQLRTLELTDMKKGKLEDLIQTENVLDTALEKANAESTKELKLRRQLEEIYGFNKQQAKDLADELVNLEDKQEDLNKSVESFVEISDNLQFDFRLVDGKIEEFISFTEEAFIDHSEDVEFDPNFVTEKLEEQREKQQEEAEKRAERIFDLNQARIDNLQDDTLQQFLQVEQDFVEEERRIRDEFAGTGLLDERLEAEQNALKRAKFDLFQETLVEEGRGSFFEVGGGFGNIFLPFDIPEQADKEKGKVKSGFKEIRQQFRTEQERLKGQEELLGQREELDAPEASSLFGLNLVQTENIAEKQLDFQLSIAKREQEIRKQRLQNQLEFNEQRFLFGKIGLQEFRNEKERLQRQIERSEERWYERREDLQDEFNRRRIQKSLQAGEKILGNVQTISSNIFDVWAEKRQEDLENQGKTQEQQREILKKEGKKRFQVMKALKIANTIATGISAAHEAWERGMEIPFVGGPALAATFAGISAAKTATEVKKLQQLSIGDRLPGGSGGGAGGGGVSGQFTQLSSQRNAERANDFVNNAQNQGNTSQQNQMNEAAQRVKDAADTIKEQRVVIDERTSEDVQRIGSQRARSLNF